MKTLRTLVLTSVLTISAAAVTARAASWTEDYAAGLARAKAENKKLLLDFTGSDWCGPCIMLEEEVFSKPAFANYAAENLVLVKLDYPRKRKLAEATRKQNEAMKETFRIRGFPTIVLLDPHEKLLMRIDGYPQGDETAFIDGLKRAIARKRE